MFLSCLHENEYYIFSQRLYGKTQCYKEKGTRKRSVRSTDKKRANKVKINTLNVKLEIINQTEVCEEKKINFYFKTRRALLIFLI